MYLTGSPKAIINGRTVMEGDSVSGAFVKTIKKDGVILTYKDNVEIRMDLK